MNAPPAGTQDRQGADEAAEEARLVRRIVAGERHLYGTLVERYQRRLWWGCLRLLGDPDEAEDAVQEAFVRAYRHLDEFDPTYRFYTWIYRIARNRSLNVLRRRKTWGLVSLSREGPDDPDDPPAGRAAAPPLESGDDASRRIERGELAAALEACRETLPADQRECFDLRHADGLSYADIAAALEIPAGTVMSRLSRAREKMRACLESKGVGAP